MKTTKHYGRAAFSTIAGLAMVTSMATSSALALESAKDKSSEPEGNELKAKTTTVESTQVLEAKVVGEFAYSQNTITPNAEIKAFFKKATKAICGTVIALAADNPLGWQLSVSGDVENVFTATVDELANEKSVKQVMTCTCGGNPAGGRSIITADVKGIPIEYLLTRARVSSSANVVTFVSSDGTEMAFPLAYVIGHHAVLSYEIGDEDLSASVGGNNQLWMTATPANYFVRDVASVVFSTENVLPEKPGTTDVHPNSPNVGVLTGTQE